MKIFCNFLGVLLLLACSNIADAQHWNLVGIPNFSATAIEYSPTVIDRNGVPYIAFEDTANGYRANVMRYNGTGWEHVGPPNFTTWEAADMALAIDSGNHLYMVFQDEGYHGHASVMTFDGTSWNYVGTPGFTPWDEGNNAIAVDRLGNIYTAFSTAPGSNPALVMKYDGTSWAAVGGGVSPGSSMWISLAIDSNNVPYVGYCDYSDHYRATVKKYDGTDWVTVGSPTFTDSAEFETIAIDKRNNLYIAYQDMELGWRASAQKFNGTSWAPLGSLGFSPTGSFWVNMRVDTAGVVYVGYEDAGRPGFLSYNGAMCMRYIHGGWYQAGNIDFSPGSAWYTSISLSPWGKVYMGIEDFADNHGATVLRLDIPGLTGPTTVCASATITLSDSAQFGRWVSTDTAVATVNDTSGIITGVAIGVDTIYYIDYGDTVQATINVLPLPVVGTVTGPTVVCVGDTIMVADTAAGGTWSISNTNASIYTDTVVGIQAGADTVLYSVTNGCGTLAATMAIAVSKYAGIITGRDTLCPNDTVALADAVTGGTWSISNTAIATISAAGTVYSLQPGTDTVSYTVSNACGDTAARYTIVVLQEIYCAWGVSKVTAGNGIAVYPNPNNGSFSVQVTSAVDEQVTLVLTNITGQQVSQCAMRTNTLRSIDEDLPAGIYLLSATTGSTRYVVKMVVE